MTPERYQQICDLARAARDLGVDRRPAFLAEACADDAELRHEVESFVLHAERAEGFLEVGAMQGLARAIAEEEPTRQFENGNAAAANLPTELNAHPAASLAPGTMLGRRYLIVRQIGEGGLGTVFLANDQRLHGAQIVIKVLKAELCVGAQGSWFEKKFQHEIKALARIDHPGVVRALDTGMLSDGRAYLVMQYISGVPLRSLVSAQGMELRRVARIIRQIAQALAAAHEQGVIHRDLKPENIMVQTVSGEEQVKLIDFGIASIWETANASAADTTRIVGTTGYMAPEQLQGKPSAASDVYALGVIAYELVTGRRPFNPDSIFEMLDLQRQGVKVMPCDLRPSLPPAAEAVILKALSFASAKRPASTREFGEDLFRALQGECLGSPTVKVAYPPRKAVRSTESHHRRVLIWLSAVLLIGACAWLFLVFRPGKNAPPLKEPPPLPERQISYTLVVRRNPQRYPNSPIREAAHTIMFDAGDRIRLRISSPQSGYLYIINEGPTQRDGLPSYNVVFPYSLGNNFSAAIAANQTVQIPQPSSDPDLDWLEMDTEAGVEKFWLIWAERLVAELESVKHYADFKHEGEIKDTNQIKLVAQYLREHSANLPATEEDDVRKQIRLKAKGDVLVGRIKLEHH